MTTSPTDLDRQDVVALLRDASWVMLTTALPDGTLLSHPMVPQGVDEDSDVWFFVSLHGDQADALRGDPHVNLSVAETGTWLSVAGRAGFVEDRAIVEQLWTDRAARSFPGGIDDPDLGLLQVRSESAQYWGVPGGAAARLARSVRAKATGGRPPGGTATTEL